MTEKILVTGATGLIGRGIVRRLQTFGMPIRAATRLPIPYAVTHPRLDVVLFDFDHPETFRPALQGVTKAFIFPRGGETNPEKAIIPLLETARQVGVAHIVLVSHFDADAYRGSGLYEIEAFLVGSGMLYTILRPNWLMQMFNPGFLWTMIRKTDTIYLPAGQARTSFVDAEDVAAVATVSLTEEGHLDRIYTLTGCEALSHGEVAQIITNASGRKIAYVPISDEEFFQSMVNTEWAPQQITNLMQRLALVRQGLTARVTDDVPRLLGRQPGRFLDFAYDHANSWGGNF